MLDLHTTNGSDPGYFAPRLGPEGEACAACGAGLAADQRYCLNCGTRRAATRVPFPEPVVMAAAPAPAPAVERRSLVVPAWSGLAGVAAVSLGILAGVLLMNARDDEPQAGAALVAATPAAATPVPTAAATVVATPEATVAAVTEFTSSWPEGTDGWTVQLQTLPKEGTTPQAVADAVAAATGQGAADAGALDSDAFASLDGGQYVIYSTVSTSKADAEAVLEGVKPNFPDAKVIEVSTTAPEPEATPEKQAAEPKEFKSPEEAQKEMRDAPDQVESEGTPPPPDDKAPGGGSEATEF